MKILCTLGTRPEAIKMAPVILALQNEVWASVRVLATAQHREMLDQVLTLFGIVADIDLDIMRANQSLPELTSRLIAALDDALAVEKPDRFSPRAIRRRSWFRPWRPFTGKSPSGISRRD